MDNILKVEGYFNDYSLAGKVKVSASGPSNYLNRSFVMHPNKKGFEAPTENAYISRIKYILPIQDDNYSPITNFFMLDYETNIIIRLFDVAIVRYLHNHLVYEWYLQMPWPKSNGQFYLGYTGTSRYTYLYGHYYYTKSDSLNRDATMYFCGSTLPVLGAKMGFSSSYAGFVGVEVEFTEGVPIRTFKGSQGLTGAGSNICKPYFFVGKKAPASLLGKNISDPHYYKGRRADTKAGIKKITLKENMLAGRKITFPSGQLKNIQKRNGQFFYHSKGKIKAVKDGQIMSHQQGKIKEKILPDSNYAFIF